METPARSPLSDTVLGSFLFLVVVLLGFTLPVHGGASDDPVEIVWRDRLIGILVVSCTGLVLASVERG